MDRLSDRDEIVGFSCFCDTYEEKGINVLEKWRRPLEMATP